MGDKPETENEMKMWVVVNIEHKPTIIGECGSEEEAWEIVETQVRPQDYAVAELLSRPYISAIPVKRDVPGRNPYSPKPANTEADDG